MKDARRLIVAACGTDLEGRHFAKELVHEQTLENLGRFSDRLQQVWDWINRPRDHEPIERR